MPLHKNTFAVALVSGALVMLASLGGCSKAETTEKFLAEARQYQQKGDSKAAIIQLKNALQKDAANKDARYLLGKIYLETGDAVSAEKELRKAASLGLSATTMLPELAKALLMQGQFQTVLDETAQDSRIKTDPELASIRGNAFMALGEKIEAQEAFGFALSANPDFAEALIGMAGLSMEARDAEAASRFVDTAISKNPNDFQAHMFKANLLRLQGKFDEAIVSFDQALKIKPDSSAPYLAKADMKIGQKKYAEAQQDITAAKKLSLNPVLGFYTQALLDFSQNKHAAAWESLQQVQRLAPDYMPGILLSGAVQASLGSSIQSEQFLRQYLTRNPANIYAQKLLISGMINKGDASGAVLLLDPLLKTTSDDSQLYALAGESHLKLKNFVKATEYFEKASTLAPKSAEYLTALGVSKLGQGENSSAVAELEKALDLGGTSPKAGALLIMTHLRMKENDKALAVAKAVEKDQPDNPLIQNLKGGIYMAKKDIVNARMSFEKAISLEPTFLPAVTNLAQLDMQDKKPEAAKKRFQAVLVKDKKNLQAMIALASLAVVQNKNEEARTWLELANTENPDSVQVMQLLAGYYLKNGQKEKALVMVTKAQASHPAAPEFMELLAQTQLAAGDKSGALESYGKLAALLPEMAAVEFKIAAIHVSMDNIAAGIDSLKKLLRITPQYLDAQVGLSALYARQGDFNEALLLSKKIQKMDEKSPAGFLQEGDILSLQKKNTLAILAYEKAFQLVRDGQTMSKIHHALVADGKAKEANSRMSQWLKEHPMDDTARLYFANTSMMAVKSKQPYIEQLQIILKNAPNNAVVLNNLAWAYAEEKDPRAQEYAEKAYKLAESSPDIMDTLGWILIEKGNIARGLPLIQKALDLAPEVLDIHYHLAVGLFKSGDMAGARKALEHIVASGKPFAKMDEVQILLKKTSAI
jgi:putative PEP-CTERM system TPR-repeat lipoprotein